MAKQGCDDGEWRTVDDQLGRIGMTQGMRCDRRIGNPRMVGRIGDDRLDGSGL